MDRHPDTFDRKSRSCQYISRAEDWVERTLVKPLQNTSTSRIGSCLTAAIRLHCCIVHRYECFLPSKDLPNMNTFCDWLTETTVISVYDSFFRNYISIVLLSSIVLSSQSYRYVATLFINIFLDVFESIYSR